VFREIGERRRFNKDGDDMKESDECERRLRPFAELSALDGIDLRREDARTLE